MKTHLYLFFVICFLSSFGLTLQAQSKPEAFVNYINRYSNLAVRHKKKYKIPASITLAQGLHESNAGLSTLAKESNNHFGIKCHADWEGEQVYYKDDGPNDCFRKYKTVRESYEDHSKFLTKNSRYAVLFSYGINDYKSWATGLQACGYATDKDYANKLIRIIDEYDLKRYDDKNPPVLKNQKANDDKKTPALIREVYKTFNLIYVIAKENDNFNLIARDMGFNVKDLIKYNEVPENFPLKKGDIVYLQKKNTKADKAYLVHIVKRGESIYSISQRYGIRLKNLYKMNKIGSNFVLTEGNVLRLR